MLGDSDTSPKSWGRFCGRLHMAHVVGISKRIGTAYLMPRLCTEQCPIKADRNGRHWLEIIHFERQTPGTRISMKIFIGFQPNASRVCFCMRLPGDFLLCVVWLLGTMYHRVVWWYTAVKIKVYLLPPPGIYAYYCSCKRNAKSHIFLRGESIVEQLVEEIEHQSQGLDLSLDPGSSMQPLVAPDFLLSKRRFVFFAGSESNVNFGFCVMVRCISFLGVFWDLSSWR